MATPVAVARPVRAPRPRTSTLPTARPPGVGTAPGGALGAPQAPGIARLQTALGNLNPTQAAAFRQYTAAPAVAPAVDPTGGYGAIALPDSQESGYRVQRNDINDAGRTGLADNTAAANRTDLGYSRNFRDAATAYSKQRAAQPMQFVNRGILGSGISHQNLSDMQDAYARTSGDMTDDQATARAHYKLAAETIENSRTRALAQVEAERNAALQRYANGSIK